MGHEIDKQVKENGEGKEKVKKVEIPVGAHGMRPNRVWEIVVRGRWKFSRQG
jgi:hypothetical protein